MHRLATLYPQEEENNKTLKFLCLDLEQRLREEKNARLKLIVTDGVFSMDGDIAPLDKICELGDKYDALVFVDEAHATGFFGKTGRYGYILHNCVHVYQCSQPITVAL